MAQLNGDDLPSSLQPHYRALIATTRGSAPLQRVGTFGLAVLAACGFSLGIAGQVLTFRIKAWPGFAPPTRFNSLDAQREACEAYIKSQVHEGWRLVDERYDDGAFSGASLDP